MNLSSKSWPPERFRAWHTRDFPCRVTDQQNFTPKLPLESKALMTWIRTIPLSQASEKLRNAMEYQKLLYPTDYAVKITRDATKVWKDDHDKLHRVGFDDQAILQITLIAAWFNYINRVADALGVGRE